MTVDEAIAYALVIRDAEDERDLALVTLAAEVKRLHTAVEAVRALQRYVVSFRRGFDDDMSIYWDEKGTWFEVDDVLAALEATDAD